MEDSILCVPHAVIPKDIPIYYFPLFPFPLPFSLSLLILSLSPSLSLSLSVFLYGLLSLFICLFFSP